MYKSFIISYLYEAQHFSGDIPTIIRSLKLQFINKIQQDATVYQNFIISYFYEAQNVSDDTLPIIRSLKLHWQPLVFHMWKVVGRVVGRRYQAQCA